MNRPLVALLLLGGAGTRLWPMSTEARPKQFLRLLGECSLFQMTMARARAAGCTDIVIIANATQLARIEADLAEIGHAAAAILLEPCRRDSAAAIAAGVAHIAARWGREAVVAALPADHLIRDEAAFARDLAEAAALAAGGPIVTFGIEPSFPATAYGYLQRGAALPGHARAAMVEKFHEKPDAVTAARYLADGGFAWNSGMFVFEVARFADEAQQHMDDIWRMADSAVSSGRGEGMVLELNPERFAAARRTSIDYALMENSRNVAMLPVSFDWSDIGTWDSVYEARPKDAAGNAIVGDAVLRDCSGCLVVAEGRRLAVAGLTDMVVVSTADGAFAAPLARAGIVKELIGG